MDLGFRVAVEQLLEPLQALKHDAEYRENSFAFAQAAHALDILESILLYNRFQANQLELKLEPVHLGDVLQLATDSLRGYLSSQNIDLDLNVQNNLPPVHGDKRLLTAALKMACHGVIDLNKQGHVLNLDIHKMAADNLRLSVLSPDIEVSKIRFQSERQSFGALQTAFELFKLNGATLSKTQINGYQGFGVSFKKSQQLQLV